MFMHLTNYAINCRNKGKFIFNKGLDDVHVGHKRSFTSVLDYLELLVYHGHSANELKQLENIAYFFFLCINLETNNYNLFKMYLL